MPAYSYLLLVVLLFVFVAYQLLGKHKAEVHFASAGFATLLSSAFFLYFQSRFVEWRTLRFRQEAILLEGGMGLPLEEILLFLVLPLGLVVGYEKLKRQFPKDFLQPHTKQITIFLLIFLGVMAGKHTTRIYTFLQFGLCMLTLGIHWSLLDKRWIGRFYLVFLIALVPYLLVEGLLTQVKMYSRQEILHDTLFSIPLEQLPFFLNLTLLTLSAYELMRGKWGRQTS